MSDPIFQIYDWHVSDELIDDGDDSSNDDEGVSEKQNYVIHLFGVNKNGKNVHCKVKDFTPYWFIELPENWQKSWTAPFMEKLKEQLPKAISDEFVCDDRQINRAVKLKYKFRNYQWNQPKKFMQLVFKSEAASRSMYYKLKKPFSFPIARLFKHQFPIYEKNVLPVLRFIHLRKIQPSSWISLQNFNQIDTKFAESKFEINYEVNWRNVFPEEAEKSAAIKIASFDIECDSSHGDFPIAKKDYQKLSSNIYEEYLRILRNGKKANPTLVKQWINCAFRDVTNVKYDVSMKSSIQTIYLKNPSHFKTVTDEEIEKMSFKILGILMKKMKGKETIESINNILIDGLPSVKGDKVIQIGTVIQDYSNPSNVKRHIVTLSGCSDLTGIEVETAKTVDELIFKWVRMMKREQPNIVTGYNIFGFDIKFLWECAEEFGCLKYLRKLGALKNQECVMETKELFSAALGHNFLYYFNSPGIVYIDLMKVIQKDHNLSSYKLDDVSTQFINSGITQFEHFEDGVKIYTKSTFSLKVGDYVAVFKQTIIGNEFVGEKRKILEMTENESFVLEGEGKNDFPENPKSFYWSVGKDNVSPQDIFDMQRGTDEDRAVVAKYCVQDCELCLNIMQKLEIITNNLGMSNVCLVPFSYLFMRGQMIKTLSLVSSECQKENYLIPELPRPKEDTKDSYEGAEVLEPTPAIFLNEPVSVLDYSSLYPSSMIGSNISHDSIIKEPKYQGEKGAKLLEEMGVKFEDVSYDNYINRLVGKTWKKSIVEEEPVVTCRFMQPTLKEDGTIDNNSRGILPRILMKLLKARKDTRNQIKTEKDAFRISVLDGLQLAYKVTANSLYGGVGAEVSSLYYKDIAASTTAIGRQHLHLAKDYVKEHFPTADIVYGDTDSIFVNFKPKASGKEGIQESIDRSVEVEEGIQKLLAYPHKLEYEKTFSPFILLRKKGYIGNKYEFDLDKFKQTSMGVVTKRRDNAGIVKYVYDGIIKRIMNDKDIDGAIRFLLTTIDDILDGNFPLQYFIITKRLNSVYANPAAIVHKALADRMGDRDPGNKPQSNDRIPFVYVETKEVPKLQGDRVEHPDYIIEHKLKVDYLFYITNQISKPCCQVMGLALEHLRKYGYRLPTNHFDLIREKLENEKKSQSEIREKLMEERAKEAYNVLFKSRVKIEEGKKYGQTSITSFFKKKT
jgi:DNA polymerase elongation subunit (family B)